MTDLRHPPPPGRPEALEPFLHGIEPRAWAFALFQSGDPERARLALAGALRHFVARSRELPLADWPLQFWTSVAGQPRLVSARGLEAPLAALPPGPRAALLLRLVAGLDFEPASQALRVSGAAYERVLREGLAQPGLDEAGVQALRARLHDFIQSLTTADRESLAALRRDALAGLPSPGLGTAPPAVGAPPAARAALPQAAPAGAGGPGSPWWKRLRPWLGLLALLLVAGLLWILPGRRFDAVPPGGNLPAESVAPAPALTDVVLVTHPDYAQLAAPRDDLLAQDLDLLSWLAAAAGGGDPAALPAPPPARLAGSGFAALAPAEQALLTQAAPSWTSLDADTRASLQANARDWLARPAAGREQLRRRALAWDRSDPVARAARRTHFLAWQRLPEADRQRLRAAAARLAALPAAEQAALREQFAQTPEDVRRLWWLGPTLGQELAPIAILFAFMPEADRPPLMAALRALPSEARADLTLLASRLSESQRQGLRRDLLDAEPAGRVAMIRQRLAQ